MIDPAIVEFYEKEELIKEDWLPKAAKTSGSRAFTTHPSKLSHPDTGVGKKNVENKTYITPVICRFKKVADGFIRSGNAITEEDTETIGDAAALKVDRFLKLKLTDGKTVLQHIKEETGISKDLLDIQTEKYDTLRKGFLEIVRHDETYSTSSKIKQVYFPIPDGYQQLSILTNSGMVFELKKRINNIRFPDEIKFLREKKHKNEYSEKGFSEFYNLASIGYGGTKPQNISALNSINGGKAHLLLCMPPLLEKLNIRFPRYNFLRESINYYEYREIFHALHKLFKTDYNNLKIREGRDYRIQSLIDLIITRMWEVRSVCNEQYLPDKCRLPKHQKIWLCDEYSETLEAEDSWLETLCKDIAGWIIRTYERVLGKSSFMLGETERVHFHNLVNQNREALR
jgi:CRISPR-associated protein Csy1